MMSHLRSCVTTLLGLGTRNVANVVMQFESHLQGTWDQQNIANMLINFQAFKLLAC